MCAVALNRAYLMCVCVSVFLSAHRMHLNTTFGIWYFFYSNAHHQISSTLYKHAILFILSSFRSFYRWCRQFNRVLPISIVVSGSIAIYCAYNKNQWWMDGMCSFHVLMRHNNFISRLLNRPTWSYFLMYALYLQIHSWPIPFSSTLIHISNCILQGFNGISMCLRSESGARVCLFSFLLLSMATVCHWCVLPSIFRQYEHIKNLSPSATLLRFHDICSIYFFPSYLFFYY